MLRALGGGGDQLLLVSLLHFPGLILTDVNKNCKAENVCQLGVVVHPYRPSTWGGQDCEFRASLDYRVRPVNLITSNGLVSTWEDVSKCYARCTGSIRSRLLSIRIRGLPLILLVEVEDINLETTFSVGPRHGGDGSVPLRKV